jgi:hypothetical protein
MRRVRRLGGGGALVVGLGLAIACANGSSNDTGDDSDAGSDGSSGGPRDVFVQPKDTGPGTDSSSSSGGSDSGACTGKVLINELEPDGTSGAEFVELFNPNTCAIDLNGWKIPYRATSDNLGVAIYTFAPGDVIPAKTYFVLGNSSFSGKKDITINGGLGNSGGQIALVDDKGAQIDAVGYGPVTGAKTFTEKSPAALPGTGKSLARTPDGTDTDDNSKDFVTATTPTPGAAN